MFGRAGTELGLIHQVEAGWTTSHTVDVVLEYRKLKYNKTIIKNSYFISFLVGLSGPRLKKKHELNSISLQPFKTHNKLEIGTISARTHSDGSSRKISFILCQMINWI